MHDPVKILMNMMKSHTKVTLYWMVSIFTFDQVTPYLADITSQLLLSSDIGHFHLTEFVHIDVFMHQ